MLKKATVQHFPFIRSLIIDGARNGAFEARLAGPEADTLFFSGLAVGMEAGYVTMNGKTNRLYAYAYFNPARDKKNPLGFALFQGDEYMTEFWMAAIAPEFRGQGLGEIMFIEALQAVKAKNMIGRCGPGSEGAAHILRKLGFSHLGTGSEGTQFWAGKQMASELKAQIRQSFAAV
jgi:ribosomal protein S18 acetylase RimI-like enzyme